MAKPYALSLYSSVLGAAPRFERPLTTDAKGWKRSTRSQGGCWQGSFSIEGTKAELQDYFRRWLGYDVQEKAGGMLSWRGMVYEMDLTLNGITRRRSLDLMANSLKTTYVTQEIVGLNKVENPGFENWTAGATDDFWTWQETVGGGNIQAAGAAHGGAWCLELTGTGTAQTTYVRQNIQVTPGAAHRVTYWTKGDAAPGERVQSGMFGIQDAGGANQWLCGPTIIWQNEAAWKDKIDSFVGPPSGEIVLFFWAPEPNTRVVYFDDVAIFELGEGVFETEWVQVEDADAGGPISTYGLKEEIIHLDNYPQATSIAYRDSYLAEYAWPWPRPVAAGSDIEARLDVFIAGYVHTMNWLYVVRGDGAEHDVDDWIVAIVGEEFGIDPVHRGYVEGAGDCQFVKIGSIASNTLQVAQMTGLEERPWDLIQELTALGDNAGNPWRCWVRLDRQVNYQQLDVIPRYFIRRDGVFDTMAGATPTNPWLLQPAVFRDMTYRPPATEPGSFLTSAQDIYVEEVEMADGWEQPALKTSLFSEADLLLAQAERGQAGT